MHPYGFAHAPANAIPLHRSPQNPPRSQSDSHHRSGWIARFTNPIKIAHRSRRVPSARAIHALIVGVLPQTAAPPVSPSLRHAFILTHSGEWQPGASAALLKRENRTGSFSRGIPRSQKPACGPSPGAATAPQHRSWSSSGCESHASSIGCVGWVEKCASAWNSDS
jgi:hypothetical protein